MGESWRLIGFPIFTECSIYFAVENAVALIARPLVVGSPPQLRYAGFTDLVPLGKLPRSFALRHVGDDGAIARAERRQPLRKIDAEANLVINWRLAGARAVRRRA